MKRNQLPLTALRTFEVAARHQNFQLAAMELAVSPAAVSRQVRDLEALLGVSLFKRLHRAVRLTEPGEVLSSHLTLLLDDVDTALTSLMVIPPSRKVVRVSVEPTFASLFLIPRLTAFATEHPDISVEIDSNAALAAVGDEIPLAVRHGAGRTSWPRTQARHLIDNAVTPMVNEALTESRILLPDDLIKVRLLQDENQQGWTRWLSMAGVVAAPLWGAIFSNSAIALQGAELGQGAALGSRLLASHLLAAQALRAPFDLEVTSGAYWLLARDFRKLTSSESTFCAWLMDQIKMARPHNTGISIGDMLRRRSPREAKPAK